MDIREQGNRQAIEVLQSSHKLNMTSSTGCYEGKFIAVKHCNNFDDYNRFFNFTVLTAAEPGCF
jgi:hypothetical protein